MSDDRPSADPARRPEAGPGPASAEVESAAGRRAFFREFATDLAQTAATVAGLTGALQRASAGAIEAVEGALGVQPASPAPKADDAARRAPLPAFRWDGEGLAVVDQRRLPQSIVERRCSDAGEVVDAIRMRSIRGAPELAQVAAIALAMSAARGSGLPADDLRAVLAAAAASLIRAAPTTATVRWATTRCLARAEELGDGAAIATAIRAEADAIVVLTTEDHRRIAAAVAAALPVPRGRPLQLVTHATVGALAGGTTVAEVGVVQALAQESRGVLVFVAETRPYLDGARLTAWELGRAGVAHSVVPDAAVGWVFATRDIDAVLLGAECIATNGDVASTIGSYPLAVLARRHGVPVLVCAPSSAIDPAIPNGSGIQLEQRGGEDVTTLSGMAITPAGTLALNPAFEVVPVDLIDAIVTEAGVQRQPFGTSLAETSPAAGT